MEDDFPRGTPARPAGPKVLVKDKVKHSAKQAVKRPARDVLFQESEVETTSKVKKKKKKIKKDEETAAEAELEKESVTVTEMEKFTPRIFSQKTISEGMLVLAAVKEVHEYEVVLSLPNGLKGFVQITDISTPFTQKLREMNVEEGAEEESLPSISALYSVGDLVQCKIKSLSSSKNGHRRIQASLDYIEINADLSSSLVKAGMVVNGYVASIEDHGYTVDLGVRGTKAFLGKQDTKKLVKVKQHNLQAGQPVTCLVKEVKAKGRSVLLSADPATVKKAKATIYSHTTLSTLLPGTKVDAVVTKILPNCLTVEVLGLYKGCVDVIHVKDNSEDLVAYRIGQTLTGVVLYNCPTTKSLGLSLTAVHQKSTSDPDGRLFADVVPGDIFKEATIVRVYGKTSVLVQLTPETRGIIYQTHLSDDKQERHSARSPGDKVQCRVLDVGFFDRLAIVSMRQSVLDKPFLGVKDIKPGMLTKGVVETVTPRGVAVKIQDRVHGFVPRTHLGDVPIQKPQERFTVGSEIELRVIVVEPAKRRVILTHKKTLVKSTLPVLTSYAQPTVGMWIHGCVVAVKDFGLIVNFYNNVKGIIPRVELGIQREASPAENFFVGQAQKCRVLRVDPENEKLALSLRKDDSAERTKRFECLKMAKVKVTKVQPEGLAVTLLPNGPPAFIPKIHLSDHLENCETLMASYTVGDVIDQAMTWSYNAKTRMTFVTCKPILIMASRNNTEIVRNFEELQTGMDLVGVMRHAMSFGVFIEFPNKIVGLAPKAAMADEFVSEASKIFQVGQTLRAKVTEVDLERKRFLVSLRVSECSHGDDLSGGAFARLETYFTERDRAGLVLREKKEFKHLISLTIGSVVHATVRHNQGQGLVCSLPHGVDAVVAQHHMAGKAKPNVGDALEACVLNVDLTSRVAELSVKEMLVAECKKWAKSKNKQAKKNKENVTAGDSGTVLLVKDDFALVQTVCGNFVYVPAKEHLNSTPSNRDEITVGQSVILGETRQVDGRMLAPLSESSRGRKPNKSRKGDGKSKKATAPKVPTEVSSPAIGQIVHAVIKSVKGTQINVEVEGGTFGRIHATEVLDDLQTGQYPLEALTIGKKVRAKVIGYRFGKRQQHLAVSHSHCGVHLLELSMRPSMLESSDEPVEEMDAEDELKGFQPGQSVNCIVNSYDDQNDLLWVHISRAIEGKIHRLNLSKHVYTLEHPGAFFKHGEVHRAKVVHLDLKHKLLELSMTGNVSADFTAGMTLNCKVTQLQEDAALLQLPFGCHGSVFLTDVNDKLVEKPLEAVKVGQFHRCCILEKRKDGRFSVSLRNSRVKNVPVPLDSDRDVQMLEDLVVGQNIRGYVRHCSSKGIFVSLSRNIHGRILLKNLSNSFVEDPSSIFPAGRLITTKILSVDMKTKQVELSSSGKDTGLEDPVPVNMRGKKKKKGKGQRSADDGNDSGLGEVDTLSDTEAEIITVTKTSKSNAPRLQLAAGFSWEESSAKPVQSGKRSASSKMAEDSDEGEDEEEEEEDFREHKRDEPPSKKSKKEKAEDDKAEEDYLYKTERALMDAERTPETVDDFDRLVASSPNSSLAWVRYMAFHLHSVDIEKARAVAERALKAINFREEQEKLNVWVAYLNLENLYGTEEDVMSVFQRALQQSEAIKVFQQLVSIFIRTNKLEQAEQLYESMIKRFKFNPDVWTGFGTFLMKNGRHEQARRLMQRSFKSLVQKDHIGVIVKFAQLEYRHAEPERGKTMFENVLSNYPKRTDIWSIYLDMTIRQGEVEPCRHLFERVIHLSLSAKKIKFFFKRYLDFEKKYGNETSIDAVKQKAVEYVESKTAVGSDL